MSAPWRATSAVPIPGGDAQLREFASEPVETSSEPLAWQRELDVAIADIDSRLSHPRRRATDAQPRLPQLGQPEINSETIDEIAWRVSQLLRREGAGPHRGEAVAAAISEAVSTAEAPGGEPSSPRRDRMPGGIAISLRIRRPFFRWPFRRRRKRAMITFADHRVT